MSPWVPMARREGGTVAAVALSPDFSADHLAFAATHTGIFRSLDGGRTWKMCSEGLISTIVQSLALSPAFSSDRTLFAGTADGRVFRSTNGGDEWSAVGSPGGGSAVIALAIAPGYEATGIVLAGTLSNGVFHSANRGERWEARNSGLPDLSVISLALAPSFLQDSTGFVATGGGLYRTDNGGKSWSEVYAGQDDVEILAVSPDFAADRTLFLGTESRGVLRSSDGGKTWQQMDSGLPDFSALALALSPDYARDRLVMVATGMGLARSENGGESWHEARGEAGVVLSLAISGAGSSGRSGEQVMLAGRLTEGVLRSEDGGVSWVSSNTGLAALALTGLALSPVLDTEATMFAWGSGEGVYRSKDGGHSWLPSSTGMEVMAVSAVALSPSYPDDATLFAATSTGAYRSQDEAATWECVGVEDRELGLLAISPAFAEDRTVAVAAEDTIHVSNDGGATWREVEAPTPGEPLSALALAVNPSGKRVLMAGCWREPAAEGEAGRVRVWSRDLPDASWKLVFTTNAMTRIVILGLPDSYSRNGKFFISCGSFVYRTVADARERTIDGILPLWVPGRTGSAGYPVVSLVAARDFDRTLTLFASARDGVYESRDGGVHWQRRVGTLDGRAPIAVALSPGFPQDETVFVLAIGGQLWRWGRG